MVQGSEMWESVSFPDLKWNISALGLLVGHLTLSPFALEKHLSINNASNLETDGLQQQNTTSGSTPLSQEQESGQLKTDKM